MKCGVWMCFAMLLCACGGDGFQSATDPIVVAGDGATPPADELKTDAGDAGTTTSSDAAAPDLADARADVVIVDDAPGLLHCPNAYGIDHTNPTCCAAMTDGSNGRPACGFDPSRVYYAPSCPTNPPFGNFGACVP